MDEDKNKKELEKEEINKVEKEVIPTKEDSSDKEMTTEEHLRENRQNHQQKVNFAAIGGFILMVGLIVGLVFALLHFCEDTTQKIEDARNSSTKIPDMTYTKATTDRAEIEYQTTSSLNNSEVSTRLPNNQPGVNSTRNTTTTSKLTVKPTPTQTPAPTESASTEPTTTELTTEPTTEPTSTETTTTTSSAELEN